MSELALSSPSRAHRAGYAVSTLVLVLVFGAGGFQDARHAPQAVAMITEVLGYPAYLLTIIGIAKIIAALVVAAPGLARLKEWAYAGMTIDLIGASASHYFANHTDARLPMIVVPLILIGVVLTSHALRPPARRLSA